MVISARAHFQNELSQIVGFKFTFELLWDSLYYSDVLYNSPLEMEIREGNFKNNWKRCDTAHS